MTKITAQDLERCGACEEQLALFNREFPDGVRLSQKLAPLFAKLGFDFVWVADAFLSDHYHRKWVLGNLETFSSDWDAEVLANIKLLIKLLNQQGKLIYYFESKSSS